MIVKPNNSDRRKHRRFLINLPLVINGLDFEVTTETQNISCSGLFCQVSRFLPVKTKIRVTIKLPLVIEKHKGKQELSCQAEIKRIEPPQSENSDRNYNIGVAFLDIGEPEKEIILQFIRKKNLRQAKELKKMYLQLKDIAARLIELEESHPTAEHFRKVVDKAIKELDDVAHILDYEIDELKNLEE